MTNDKKHFSPPFCPNPKCELAASPSLSSHNFFARKGTVRRHDGSLRFRFSCSKCGRGFSNTTFSLNYRCQKRGHINARIFKGVVHNRSNRSLARELKVSEWLIRHRVMRLAQSALLNHSEYLKSQTISEEVAYDGLEAFARSQYEPNNVNQAVGSRSLYCYLFNFSPMNRKGMISERQKKYLFKLEEAEGRFNPRSIRKSTFEIFSELAKRKDPSLTQLTIRSDEHFQYRRAYRDDLSIEIRAQIKHETVSSKACRNYKNILFPVNHLDLLIRRKVAAFSRETICFSKKPSRMLHKYILYICYKNYMVPQFVKPHKNNAHAHTHSPAMVLKITNKLLKFHQFFKGRHPNPNLSELPLDWGLLYQDRVPFERAHRFIRNNA